MNEIEMIALDDITYADNKVMSGSIFLVKDKDVDKLIDIKAAKLVHKKVEVKHEDFLDKEDEPKPKKKKKKKKFIEDRNLDVWDEGKTDIEEELEV
jgi:hypothetical protein